MANSLFETRLQGIMVMVFIVLDWIFVLMTTATMIPCRHVLERELAIVGNLIAGSTVTRQMQQYLRRKILTSFTHRLAFYKLFFT